MEIFRELLKPYLKKRNKDKGFIKFRSNLPKEEKRKHIHLIEIELKNKKKVLYDKIISGRVRG